MQRHRSGAEERNWLVTRFETISPHVRSLLRLKATMPAAQQLTSFRLSLPFIPCTLSRTTRRLSSRRYRPSARSRPDQRVPNRPFPFVEVSKVREEGERG